MTKLDSREQEEAAALATILSFANEDVVAEGVIMWVGKIPLLLDKGRVIRRLQAAIEALKPKER